MAASSLLQKRVKADKNDDDFEEFSDTNTDGSEEVLGFDQQLPQTSKPKKHGGHDEDVSSGSEFVKSDQDDEESESEGLATTEEAANPTAHISFGALASAQASLGQKRKREPVASTPKRSSRSPSPFHEAEERRAGKKTEGDAAGRQSKHAPAVQSSKKAVSRKRAVIHVPASTARDPRFSSLSGHADERRVERNYEFLNDYRKKELTTLQKELRETKNATKRDELKRLVRAMEDRERARKAVEAERAVRQEHRRQEREKVREGKKPYFLKRSEVKKKILEKEFDELGPKKAERRMERRRKKMTAKDRKDMPHSRRELGAAEG